MSDIANRYVMPTTAMQRRLTAALNTAVMWLVRHGISVAGARILAVRGRTSGEWRTSPVNLLEVDGTRFLVAPRGRTQWVRNIRVCGEGELRLGHRVEPFRAHELIGEEQLPVMREYLRRWGWEVGQFVDGLTKDSTDDQLRAVAPGFPVFRIESIAK